MLLEEGKQELLMGTLAKPARSVKENRGLRPLFKD